MCDHDFILIIVWYRNYVQSNSNSIDNKYVESAKDQSNNRLTQIHHQVQRQIQEHIPKGTRRKKKPNMDANGSAKYKPKLIRVILDSFDIAP